VRATLAAPRRYLLPLLVISKYRPMFIKMRISKPRISKSYSLGGLTHLTPAFFLKYKYKMSSGTNAQPARAGFNQSGGAYFVCVNALAATNSGTTSDYLNVLASAGSNSGGAWVGPTFKLENTSNVFSAKTVNEANESFAAVGTGKLLKDMGKTVVSAGRTFRKFAAVGTGSLKYASSFGVQGGAPSAPNGGYASFYLEVAREGNPGSTTALPAPIARYY